MAKESVTSETENDEDLYEGKKMKIKPSLPLSLNLKSFNKYRLLIFSENCRIFLAKESYTSETDNDKDLYEGNQKIKIKPSFHLSSWVA